MARKGAKRNNQLQVLSHPGRGRKNKQIVRGSGIGADNTRISYNCYSGAATTDTNGNATVERFYIPGNTAVVSRYTLPTSTGLNVLSNYSEGRFEPGSFIKWVPSVSLSTPGRVIVGFTTNPEIMTATITIAAAADYLKSFGNAISFPVWEETVIPLPTYLRRKMFDVNVSAAVAVDVLDRACQVYMLSSISGATASTNCGYFEFHDKVMGVGLAPASTYT